MYAANNSSYVASNSAGMSRLARAHSALLTYANNTITTMSYDKSSTQLTLHLQSSAAAAAAAEAAAAAAEADPALWMEHQVRGLLRKCS
jgi:hypothetical protein